MSHHRARVEWSLGGHDFHYDVYSRNHLWRFENGVEIQSSAALEFLGDPARVDPEAAFVARLASCHMLTFLAIASRKRAVVEAYEDDAVGYLEKNAKGKLAVARVELNPKVVFAANSEPTSDGLRRTNELAHNECLIANSVLTDVTVAG